MAATSLVICDDMDEIRMMLTLAFRRVSDVTVVGEASNGQEAIERAQEHRPDAMLLDINMPVRDGLSALPEILKVSPQTKVLMLTGFEAGALEAKALSLGAVRYIEKGTSLQEIIEAVRTAVAA